MVSELFCERSCHVGRAPIKLLSVREAVMLEKRSLVNLLWDQFQGQFHSFSQKHKTGEWPLVWACLLWRPTCSLQASVLKTHINPVFRNIQMLKILQYKHLTSHFRDQCKKCCYKLGAQLSQKKTLDILVNPRRTDVPKNCTVMIDAEILTV